MKRRRPDLFRRTRRALRHVRKFRMKGEVAEAYLASKHPRKERAA